MNGKPWDCGSKNDLGVELAGLHCFPWKFTLGSPALRGTGDRDQIVYCWMFFNLNIAYSHSILWQKKIVEANNDSFIWFSSVLVALKCECSYAWSLYLLSDNLGGEKTMWLFFFFLGRLYILPVYLMKVFYLENLEFILNNILSNFVSDFSWKETPFVDKQVIHLTISQLKHVDCYPVKSYKLTRWTKISFLKLYCF